MKIGQGQWRTGEPIHQGSDEFLVNSWFPAQGEPIHEGYDEFLVSSMIHSTKCMKQFPIN